MESKSLSISVSDGFFDAYVTLPPSGQGPGILLIQEIFGVNSHIRSIADKLASEGFVVLAPDLFWRMKPNLELGYEGANFDEALRYYEKFDEQKGLADLREAAEYLRDLKPCTGRVGAMGFCLGGKLTYRLAACFNLNAAVAYYPVMLDKHLDEADKIKCNINLYFADQDRFVSKDTFDTIKTALAPKSNFHIYLYEGVDHGFNCDERPAYNKEAAESAWNRSLDLLHVELKTGVTRP